MAIYLLTSFSFILASIFDIIHTKWNKNQKFYCYFLFALMLFFMVGGRACGFDYDNYKYYYDNVQHSIYWNRNADYFGIEKGYAILNYICTSFRQLLLVMAFLTMGTYSIFIYKKSPLPFLSLFLLLGTFVYPMMMGQYRQALAIGFVLMSILYSNHLFLFLSFIGLASFFHISALLSLLLLFVPKRICNKKTYVILLLIALITNLLLGNIFGNYLSLFPSFIENKMEVYTEAEQNMRYGLNMAMLLRIAIFGLFWWKRDSLLRYKDGIYFLNIYFLSLLIYLGLGFLPQLGGRGSIYFYFFEIILASMLIKTDVNRKHKIGCLILFLLLGTYRQITFFSEWGDEFIPYKYDFLSWCI